VRVVLIANRGEIAARIARSCQARGLGAVAVYSDVDVGQPHVRAADRAVRIGPPKAYLDPAALIDAARRAGAESLHPGYGFLSENADFADAVAAAGLTWIGPPGGAIRALGDKAAAKALARAHGVPTTPSAGPEGAEALARDVGFPLLVKAVAGGGGRGMRRVDRLADLSEAIASAEREAASSFGRGDVLIERWVGDARHVEVQVFADAHGAVVHLLERECSVQRRHQKVLEEAPSPAVDAALRERLGTAAVALARAAGYVGAGTVEFLLEEDGSFWFLEMNTRLQVEHPVTECITGLDLVDLQLAVASGEHLPIRQSDVTARGHAIEARLVAEDPLRDFAPASGALAALDLPGGEGVRIDAGYEAGSEVSTHYDGLLAKIIAWGPDRASANRRLRRALERAWAPGLPTNLPLLRQIAAHPEWEAARLDTGFLPRTGLPVAPPANLALGAIAATLAGIRERAGAVPAGWRLGEPAWQADRWRAGAEEIAVAWRPEGDGFALRARDATHHAILHGGTADVLDVELDGIRASWRVARRPGGPIDDGATVWVHFGTGESMVALVPRFPAAIAEEEEGTCVAPTPGTVTRVEVAVGDAVVRGQRLATIEAMKMEHAVTAPHEGTVTSLPVAVGDAVRAGAIIARIEA
jgi:acetyl/propionyl-CoA carboxylase alpha subunit